MINGELRELYAELDKRITAFEAVMEERWKNHAERGDRIDKMTDDIWKKLNSVSCTDVSSKVKSVQGNLNIMWSVICIMLVGIIGMAFKVLAK